MGDKPNFRSIGEDPLEDPMDMAPNPLSSDLLDKGLVGSNVSIFLKKLVLVLKQKINIFYFRSKRATIVD